MKKLPGKQVALLILVFSIPLWSQVGYYFGQNKVIYKKFDWAVFQTEHFDVHYYPEEEQAARDAARMAERGYDYLREVLDHEVKDRIPLLLFASHNDFQQTNVISGIIDQGTRGVTEGARNRVILPLSGSYRDFNHVLVHELVHAFQFDLMLNSKIANKNFNPPLWFVEGMAEYLSIGMDNTTRMWIRDGLLNHNLLSISQLNSAYDIRVYRLGESLWHYIGETYGKQKVGDIFKSAVAHGYIEVAFKKHLGLNSDELSEKWHEYATRLAMPPDSTLQTADEFAERITGKAGYYHRMNLVPSVSPDGRHIAYIANKDLHEDIYLINSDEEGNLTEEKLIDGGESKRFETLRFFETTIGWSADGNRIAFISKSGKDDALYIMNPHTKQILRKFVFDQLSGLQSPSFSPAGERLALVGISGGISDLYLLNLEDGSLTRLTDDRFAVLHPCWSPQGNEIAFVTDRGPGSDEAQLLFGDYDLAIYDLSSGQITMITELDGNASNPQWSPDGKEIAFIADHRGIPNVFRINLESREIAQLTSLKNGVSGISETTPALSWSANGRYLVFSAFQNGYWHLYRKDLYEPRIEIGQAGGLEVEDKSIAVSLEEQSRTSSGDVDAPARKQMPVEDITGILSDKNVPESNLIALDPDSELLESSIPATAPLLGVLPDPNTIYQDYPLADVDSIEEREYKSKFKLAGAYVGGGYDTYWGGVGEAQFLFSDMLGNHNFLLSTQLQFNSLLHSNFGITYINQGNRINYGIQAFQAGESYSVFATFNSLGLLRNTYRGFNGIISYPFNRFSRVELYGGITWADQDIVEEIYNFSSIDRDTYDIGSYNYAQLGAAYVFDNTIYAPVGPLSGRRSRFSVETTTNDFQFTNFIGDYRRYFNIMHRSVLAWRLLGGTSVGRDQQLFSIGGPYTYRGADYDALLGTKFLISNLEYRFPLLPFLPANFDMLSGAVFYDAAAAWGINLPGYAKETFQPFTTENGFRLNDLKSALGVGFRLNLGYFLLQYDIGWPTDFRSFGAPVAKFSIGTFF